jgi:hypothetical protein
MEGGPEAPLELPRGGASGAVALGPAGHQEHRRRRVGAELVVDGLHRVLVADPRRGADFGPRQRSEGDDQGLLRPFAAPADVGSPAIEEAVASRGDDHDLGLAPAVAAGDLRDPLDCAGVLERLGGEDDQQVAAIVASRRRDDRVQGRMANRHRHERRGCHAPDRHAKARASEVEAADDRDRDRGDDRRQLPGCQEVALLGQALVSRKSRRLR